jgi:hypothetical protein
MSSRFINSLMTSLMKSQISLNSSIYGLVYLRLSSWQSFKKFPISVRYPVIEFIVPSLNSPLLSLRPSYAFMPFIIYIFLLSGSTIG